MAQATEVPHKRNDLPWLIGAGAIFGPALFYVLASSPGKEHAEGGHGAHDASSVTMKDDEGNEAEVGGEIGKSLSEDAPKSADASASAGNPHAGSQKQAESVADTAKVEKDTVPGSSDRTGTYKPNDKPGPTEMGEARPATQESKPPKVAHEESKDKSN